MSCGKSLVGKLLLRPDFLPLSVTVWLTATALDLTTVTRAGERVAWPGTYTVRFGVRETLELGMGYAEHTIEVRDL